MNALAGRSQPRNDFIFTDAAVMRTLRDEMFLALPLAACDDGVDVLVGALRLCNVTRGCDAQPVA